MSAPTETQTPAVIWAPLVWARCTTCSSVVPASPGHPYPTALLHAGGGEVACPGSGQPAPVVEREDVVRSVAAEEGA